MGLLTLFLLHINTLKDYPNIKNVSMTKLFIWLSGKA
jgi:hypothetical protein